MPELNGTELPAPMTPPDCDLTDFEFMPVMVRRLIKSDTWSLGTGDERAAAVALWFESWHQVPAGSLPSDDRLLRRLADSEKWARVKNHALRGWILCSDGRLYHPVVAQKALESWIEKLLNSISGAVGNAKRWQLSIDTSVDVQRMRDTMAMLVAVDPQTRYLRKKAILSILNGSPPDPDSSPPDRPPIEKPSPPKKEIASPPDRKTIAPRIAPRITPESGGDRKGQGQGQLNTNTPPKPPPRGRATRRAEAGITLAEYIDQCRAERRRPIPPDHFVYDDCQAAGITDEMLQLAWLDFLQTYTKDEKTKGKTYIDWPRHFANAVNKRWGRLWDIDKTTNQAKWSITGLQRKAVEDARMEREQPALLADYEQGVQHVHH